MSERNPPTGQSERDHSLRPIPRVWIASLADYNAGRLHGAWVDAAVEDDELIEAAQRILATSQEPAAEEWGIFDYENFASYQVGEHESLADVARVARGLAEFGPAFAAWAELHEGELDVRTSFEDAYLGEYDSPEDWGHEVLSDQMIEDELDRAVPDSLRGYVSIDYAAFARDAELGGDVVIVYRPGGVWVFSSG